MLHESGLTQAHVGRRLIVENALGARYDGIVQAVTEQGCIMRPVRVDLGNGWQNLNWLKELKAVDIARVCDEDGEP